MSVNRGVVAPLIRMLCMLLLLGVAYMASAFVLIGPVGSAAWNGGDKELNFGDHTANAISNNWGNNTATHDTFGVGVPKALNKFFRWNVPYLTYSFDASFINYFGFEGMEAVHDAFEVLNDFFVPADGSYKGVTELDLARHGFAGNYNTSWINTTAQNAQIIDIKSLVLGMLVNQLGIGNPHRHAFSAIGLSQDPFASRYNIKVALRNYDPYTRKETDIINGVQYAYRLIHNATIPQAGALPTPGVIDMEEFTADTSGNAWTSVASITDAFYGETMIYWSDQPSLFDFGVYYDGANAMGGRYEPRHALTFDDAGGLKYLYSTNTYAYEGMDNTVQMIVPPQYMPTTQQQMQAMNSNWSGVPAGLNFLNRDGKSAWPRGPGGTAFTIRPALPIHHSFILAPSGSEPVGSFNTTDNVTPQTAVLRGGCDKLQFYHQPFDSLFGQTVLVTNFTWKVTYVGGAAFPGQAGQQIGGLNNTTPGAITWRGQNFRRFVDMTVQRTVEQPDFLFAVRDLGLSGDGVPIAFQRAWYETSDGSGIQELSYLGNLDGDVTAGPGGFHPPDPNTVNVDNNRTYYFTKLSEDFDMVWSGEQTLVGEQVSPYSMWGHIKGPGPNDVLTFPRDATQWRIENKLIPDASPPTITLISDNGGAGPIEQNTYTRTEETLSIIGKEMASVTAIEIMSGGLVLHTIMPVDKYVQSNTQIDIPPGVLTEVAEGAALELRVWNSVGVSQKGPQKFKIETGRPVITSTTADGIVYNREETLTVRGYGFKSRTPGQAKLGYIRVDDAQGAAVYDKGVKDGGVSDGLPFQVDNMEVIDDTTAVLPPKVVGQAADASSRRLRVARSTVVAANDLGKVLSPPTNELFAFITAKPVIASLAQNNATGDWEIIADTTGQPTGMFKRDRSLEINGTALNTLSVIEVVEETGNSFANPVFIQLPNAAVSVEDDGTRILVGANAFPYPDADTNGSVRRAFRLYNAVGSTDLNGTLLFSVNTQPVVTGIGGFVIPGFFNRDKLTGDDVAIYGSGLKAIGEIHIIDANGSDLIPSPRITLPNAGVTVTDTQISIDTQVAQFSEALTADTDLNNTTRIFELYSARDNATSPVADRFSVGVPPGSIALGGYINDNYRRDTNTLTITGSGMGMITNVEIVDMLGNRITGANALTPTTGINFLSSNSITIDANASGWAGQESLLDSVGNLTRRIRVTTPLGSVTSNSTTGGAFTVSAKPEFLPAGVPTADATFNGGVTYGGGTWTFTAGGFVQINGKNFRGVKKIEFRDEGSLTPVIRAVSIDPNNLPLGYSISADGTWIRILAETVPVGWYQGGGLARATICLTSAGDDNATTPEIATLP